MKKLKKFMAIVEKTNVFIGKLNIGVLLLAVLVIVFEVVMRHLFNLPTNWGHELMTLLFAMQYMFVAGYCHYHRAHVRVDAFYVTRSKRTRAFFDLFTGIFLFIFTIAFMYTSWDFYWSSQTMGGGGDLFGVRIPGERSFTDWGPPMAPVKLMMPIGAALLFFQQVVWTIRDMHIVLTGKEI